MEKQVRNCKSNRSEAVREQAREKREHLHADLHHRRSLCIPMSPYGKVKAAIIFAAVVLEARESILF
ncbi:hypothetical protein RG963_01660 [Methanosarcina sp. Z-7115]|uniref:Mobile element protein n=1 Tax=Methanosarcina baikalica TaxID=3073890 RepID=A0ABU2CXT1_9EURY|nr:hypothetical protein [Methanosarcina sp. Z-7115]MDR7664508.1 hypothetical protein [Methanosarcina sp. Z-7115]